MVSPRRQAEEMRKIIKKWGNAAGILFSAEDLKLYGLEIGDIVDLTDIHKIEGKKQKKSVVKKEVKKEKKKEDLDDLLKRMPQ